MGDDNDVIWALRLGARSEGLTPNAASVAGFVKSLEYRGWMYEEERGPTWATTPAGLIELARLETTLGTD